MKAVQVQFSQIEVVHGKVNFKALTLLRAEFFVLSC